jgi:hypothetical protein
VERRLEPYAYGLLSIAGSPEVVFHPVSGIRVSAEGYEIWTKYLDDIRKECGFRLAHGIPLPIVVRLKHASDSAVHFSRATSPDETSDALTNPHAKADFPGFSGCSVRASKARDL